MNKLAIIITGLPGSGKSTMAAKLSGELNLPYVDKDEILEELFASNPVTTLDEHACVALRSEKILKARVQKESAVIVVANWKTGSKAGIHGTSLQWVFDAFDETLEIFCECSHREAFRRFCVRNRHPFHLDRRRDKQTMLQWMSAYGREFPISNGPVFTVRTD